MAVPRVYPTYDSVKEYGDGLRILEADNRKKLESTESAPAPQFAEFSNMLGQLQQNGKQPQSPKRGTNSTGIPTPLTNPPINTIKKKIRRKQASNSVPATPNTPAGTPNGVTVVKRSRKKRSASVTTPLVRDELGHLESVAEGRESTTCTNNANPASNGGPVNASSVGPTTTDAAPVTGTPTGPANVTTSGNASVNGTSGNGSAGNSASGSGINGVNGSNGGNASGNASAGTSGYDTQFLEDFNGSEQFFDFGLYGENSAEMLGEFWDGRE